LDLLFIAIMWVESRGDVSAIGDGGRSRGPFQISRAYWRDAVKQLEREGDLGWGSYDYKRDVRKVRKCEVIVRAYWRRWCPDAYVARDFETLARVHNGGPRGAGKEATVAYWRKVRRVMKRLERRKAERGDDV